jgi:hypothetical protein
MKLLLLTISTAILGLGAAHWSDTPAVDACNTEDCDIRIECTSRGTCLVTCLCPDGRTCTKEIDCPDDSGCGQTPTSCKPADCKPADCNPADCKPR